MGRHDLSEIDLQDGARRIRLRRGSHAPVALPPPTPAAPVAQAAPRPEGDARATPAAEARPSRPTVPIKSPGVGTFYVSSKPGAEPFVKVGSRVTPTSVVGLLEAMKLFNEIQAECTGVIAEVLVENQQAVEYGQVLFKVDPTG